MESLLASAVRPKVTILLWSTVELEFVSNRRWIIFPINTYSRRRSIYIETNNDGIKSIAEIDPEVQLLVSIGSQVNILSNHVPLKVVTSSARCRI
ncbi:MAG: hypothetical protein ACTS6G_05175 [Candidatus Hodgkinia cicadicola]